MSQTPIVDQKSPPPTTHEHATFLIEHARSMWEAELGNFNRFTGRGRLIVVSTTALLGFVSAIAIVARPGEKLNDQADISTIVLGVSILIPGFILLCIGFFLLITSARIFVQHGEEDAGSLPNPVDFGRIGHQWWVTQPTIDTVEERYLMALAVRRLSWIQRTPRLLHYLPMKIRRRWYGLVFLIYRNLLFKAFRDKPKLRQAAEAEYCDWISYKPNDGSTAEAGFTPRKRRGPRDMASLIVAIELLAARDKHPGNLHKQIKFAKNNILSHMRDAKLWNSKATTSFFQYEPATPPRSAGSNAQTANDETAAHDDKKAQGEKNLKSLEYVDLLHPQLVIRSSSYYLQFAEAFAFKNLGTGGKTSDNNPTGSGRVFMDFDPSTLEGDADNVFDEITWRVFVSAYFAAQDLRSSNWNLWFRVKRAERRFLSSFFLILLAFILLTAAETLNRSGATANLASYFFSCL